jgi:hypothetical protein
MHAGASYNKGKETAMAKLDEVLKQIEWANAGSDLIEMEIEDYDDDVLDMINKIDREVQEELRAATRRKSAIK